MRIKIFIHEEYTTKFYRIPKVKIGSMTLFKPILQDQLSEFIKNAISVENGEDPSLETQGRLSWGIFRPVNLLIDMKNSQIAFCDSIETLKTKGYPVEIFTKTSLHLDQGLVEIYVNSPNGPLRCVLDTASTWNILNTPLKEGESLTFRLVATSSKVTPEIGLSFSRL